jgi:hypothetical protein
MTLREVNLVHTDHQIDIPFNQAGNSILKITKQTPVMINLFVENVMGEW